jgi:glutathione S-transferase
MSAPVPRLITIPISHYCEKARWALDRAGIEYREERHVQGIHRIAARRAGGGHTTPVLVTSEGVFPESEDILRWADGRLSPDQRLFPADPSECEEVERLSRRFDAGLGPAGRRFMYMKVLAHRDTTLRFNNQGVPRWEDRALRLGWPLAVRFLGKALGIRPGVEVEDEAIVWEDLDYVGELLADGRPHLCGERFSAADLTFAALSAAVLAPPQYGITLPQPDVMPPDLATFVNRVRDHPAGRYALALFSDRGARAPARDPSRG